MPFAFSCPRSTPSCLWITMLEFLAPIQVDGREARAAYDCSASNSSISSSYIKSMGLYSRSQRAALVSVNTSSGSFTCSVNLLYHRGPMNADVVLGRDWFNYCTTWTAIEDEQISLIDGRRLVFNAPPYQAVFAESDLIGELMFLLLCFANVQFF